MQHWTYKTDKNKIKHHLVQLLRTYFTSFSSCRPDDLLLLELLALLCVTLKDCPMSVL